MGCYVLDTTVLSNFAHARRPLLIRTALGENVFTTPVVMAELAQGMDMGYVPACKWDWLDVLKPDERIRRMADELRRVVDRGEAESLAAALVRGCVFLSDDFAARELAKHHGVKVSGTLGVLIKLVKLNALPISEADTLLAKMIEKGYRSPVTTIFELF